MNFCSFIDTGKRLFCIALAISLLSTVSARSEVFPDSLKVKGDTVRMKHDSLKTHSPGKATLYSAILPGAGQYYNKKYWKMPIIYAGFGVLIYSISFNQKNYKTYQEAYSLRFHADSSQWTYTQYTTDNLLTLRDYYRHNRDLCYILSGVLYFLNVLDAYVDAELFKFDVSDDLSLKGEPFMINFGGGTNLTGLRLTLSF